MKLKTTDTLEVLLAGAVTTNQCPLIAAFADVATDSTACAPSSTDGQTNSTTAVTWVASPATGFVRQIAYLSLYNADTASVTATVRINNGSTTRIVRKFTLLTGESFAYKDGNGFSVYDASGTPKSSAGLVNPMTTSQDIIVGGAGGAAGRLGVGSAGQVLAVNGSGNLAYTDLHGTGLGSGELGTRIIGINSQSAAYTLVAADSGCCIYHPTSDTTARTWTIPANGSVAFPVGTAVTFDNDIGAGAITIAITTDTLVLVGAGTTGSRTLAAGGQATAVKVTSTRWRISGTGLT